MPLARQLFRRNPLQPLRYRLARALGATAMVGAAAVGGACAGGAIDTSVPGNDTISADDLRADLFYLAGDGMEGRRTQTRGNALAAEFIASRFARVGLEPAVGDSFFQEFELVTTSLGEDNSLAVAVDGRPVPASLGRDVTPTSFAATAEAEGEVAFVGFGIDAPALGWNDYEGHDVAGKVVLLMDHEPGENDPGSPFDGLVTSEASRDWRKAWAAQEAGAAGVLFVSDAHNHPRGTSVRGAHASQWGGLRTRYSLASWFDRIEIPAARISRELAETMVAGTGLGLVDIAADAEAAGGSVRELPGVRVVLRTDVVRSRLPDRNVVGMIRGSDPELADEAVLICAHYDHDGRSGDRIFNGADDDGSGTVALIEIAEAYAAAVAAGQRPRRSVLFAAWNSEEVGLLGAWAYTEAPIVPLENLAAVLNMDMIGRNEEVPADGGGRFRGLTPQTAEENADSVHLMAYSYSSRLREAALAANEDIGLRLELELDDNPSQLVRRSDHWPFLQVGVPALFFHTGLHPDYHREDDTPDRINYPKMERIVRLVHALSWRLAQADDRPTLDERTGALR